MITINRSWSMPNRWTFTIKPIAELLDRVLSGRTVIVDPFCGKSERASHGNDISMGGVHAVEYMDGLIGSGVKADAVLIDPPYSPRQLSECYKSIGLAVKQTDTQNAALYKSVKDRTHLLLRAGGIVVCCGWNTSGMGKSRGYKLKEILLVPHGGAHNDTLVTVEEKVHTIFDI